MLCVHARLGSDVLLWSEGNTPMVLFLSFPPELDEACIGNTKSYTVHPTFTVPCAGGTLFIFTCLDDLFFCHEAHFEEQVLKSAGATGYRFVFVFRWLTSARRFYIPTLTGNLPCWCLPNCMRRLWKPKRRRWQPRGGEVCK